MDGYLHRALTASTHHPPTLENGLVGTRECARSSQFVQRTCHACADDLALTAGYMVAQAPSSMLDVTERCIIVAGA